MAKEIKDTLIAFRTTAELKSKLENAAAKDSRTLSNMIELVLEKYLQELKENKKEKR